MKHSGYLYLLPFFAVSVIFCKSRNYSEDQGKISEYQVTETSSRVFRIWLEEGFVWLGDCQSSQDLICKADAAGVPNDDLRQKVLEEMDQYFERLLKDHFIRSTIYTNRTHENLFEKTLREDIESIQKELEKLRGDLERVQTDLKAENGRIRWRKNTERVESLTKDEKGILARLAQTENDLKNAKSELQNKRQ